MGAWVFPQLKVVVLGWVDDARSLLFSASGSEVWRCLSRLTSRVRVSCDSLHLGIVALTSVRKLSLPTQESSCVFQLSPTMDSLPALYLQNENRWIQSNVSPPELWLPLYLVVKGLYVIGTWFSPVVSSCFPVVKRNLSVWERDGLFQTNPSCTPKAEGGLAEWGRKAAGRSCPPTTLIG